ncbi:hypothetical protein M0R45_000373 [Rubus argutus]|uniref:Endonuclease/exonuclease/phosphatase domain-containing protein n=1 Tax=Rubus argutus TaxID=59490 RepID=A0AAW1VQG2_RUBAR
MRLLSWNVRGMGRTRTFHDLKDFIRVHKPDFIDVMVNWENGKECRVTGFYGESIASHRYLPWDLLRELAGARNGPWLVCGDFNEILDCREKTEHVVRAQRVGKANVKEIIDRGFGNLELLQDWGGFTTRHLVTMVSDHCPLLF